MICKAEWLNGWMDEHASGIYIQVTCIGIYHVLIYE